MVRILKMALETISEITKMFYTTGFSLVSSGEPINAILGIIIVAVLTWIIGSVLLSIIRFFER